MIKYYTDTGSAISFGDYSIGLDILVGVIYPDGCPVENATVELWLDSDGDGDRETGLQKLVARTNRTSGNIYIFRYNDSESDLDHEFSLIDVGEADILYLRIIPSYSFYRNVTPPWFYTYHSWSPNAAPIVFGNHTIMQDISAWVFYTDGTPASGINITLYVDTDGDISTPEDCQAIASNITDSEGRFFIGFGDDNNDLDEWYNESQIPLGCSLFIRATDPAIITYVVQNTSVFKASDHLSGYIFAGNLTVRSPVFVDVLDYGENPLEDASVILYRYEGNDTIHIAHEISDNNGQIIFTYAPESSDNDTYFNVSELPDGTKFLVKVKKYGITKEKELIYDEKSDISAQIKLSSPILIEITSGNSTVASASVTVKNNQGITVASGYTNITGMVLITADTDTSDASDTRISEDELDAVSYTHLTLPTN